MAPESTSGRRSLREEAYRAALFSVLVAIVNGKSGVRLLVGLGTFADEQACIVAQHPLDPRPYAVAASTTGIAGSFANLKRLHSHYESSSQNGRVLQLLVALDSSSSQVLRCLGRRAATLDTQQSRLQG